MSATSFPQQWRIVFMFFNFPITALLCGIQIGIDEDSPLILWFPEISLASLHNEPVPPTITRPDVFVHIIIITQLANRLLLIHASFVRPWEATTAQVPNPIMDSCWAKHPKWFRAVHPRRTSLRHTSSFCCCCSSCPTGFVCGFAVNLVKNDEHRYPVQVIMGLAQRPPSIRVCTFITSAPSWPMGATSSTLAARDQTSCPEPIIIMHVIRSNMDKIHSLMMTWTWSRLCCCLHILLLSITKDRPPSIPPQSIPIDDDWEFFMS